MLVVVLVLFHVGQTLAVLKDPGTTMSHEGGFLSS